VLDSRLSVSTSSAAITALFMESNTGTATVAALNNELFAILTAKPWDRMRLRMDEEPAFRAGERSL
jgi:uncharacterized FlgJ-related protein